MIYKFFIELVINVAVGFFVLINSLFPTNTLDINSTVATILTVTSQAGNFMYFLFGDSLNIILPLLSILLPTRFVLVPILSFLRGFIRLGS